MAGETGGKKAGERTFEQASDEDGQGHRDGSRAFESERIRTTGGAGVETGGD